ncbi:MAG: hypothetical protein ACJ8AW_45710 [Rhodopila sp.]
MSKKPQTTMDKVRSAILGTSGPGSLYRWLRLHHDEMAEALAQVRRPSWQRITDALREENLQDADGKSPTPERVRQTWLAVRKDVAAATKQGGGQAADNTTPSQAVPDRPTVRVLDAVKPTGDTDAADDLAASLDAGRGWRPKDNKRR